MVAQKNLDPTIRDHPTQALIVRARGGDEEAWRELFRALEPPLQASIRPILMGSQARELEASDVMQETFLIGFQRIRQFEDRGRGSFRAWLHQIARNVIRDRRKQAMAAKRHHENEPCDLESRAWSGETPSEASAHRWMQEEVMKAISSLEEPGLSIVLHRVYLGLTWNEIVDQLDAPDRPRNVASVRRHFASAIASIAIRCGD